MSELTERRFNENVIQLKNHRVKSSILPMKADELDRSINIQSNTIIEGAVYAHKLEIQQGNTEIKGAVFTQLELYINSEAQGDITFRKSVGSADSVVSRAPNCNLTFHSDINAKSVTLYNAFIAGSIYADEVILQNCVVVGGVFAAQSIDLTNCVVGTFNSQSVKAAQQIWVLMPSVFTIEAIVLLPGTKIYNLSLADLGALYRGAAPAPNSGRIEMNVDTDEVRTSLANDEVQKTIRSYTIVGKVLAADLLNFDMFQNHFLLTSASLCSQLFKSYHMTGPDGQEQIEVSPEKIKAFFFDVLYGRIAIPEISGSFSIADIVNNFK